MPTAKMRPWKQAVARAFDGAEGYDGAALIQAGVAEGLARRIAALPLAPSPRVLEVGCGTGFLTRALLARLAPGRLVVSDLAPAMVGRTRARLAARPGPAVAGLVMDAEQLCLAPGFDLICSSLAAQWFEDLEGTLGRLAGLLAPGGLMAVTTLASGTFREWREAHEGLGAGAGTPLYPLAEALARFRFAGCDLAVSVEAVTETHADGRAFLAALRAIGAQTSGSARPLPAGTLRRALGRFDRAGARITYEVATLLVRRNA